MRSLLRVRNKNTWPVDVAISDDVRDARSGGVRRGGRGPAQRERHEVRRKRRLHSQVFLLSGISTSFAKLTRTAMLSGVISFGMAGCVRQVEPPSIDRTMKSRQWIEKGVWYLRSGELDKAEAAFTTSAELHTSAISIDGLGCIAFRRGNHSVAEKLFHRAIELDSNYGTAYANLGLLYDVAGKQEVARQYFEKAIQLSPDDAQLRNNFAVLIGETGERPSQAIRELHQAEVLGAHAVAATNMAVLAEIE